jgi:ABC-2 type transport system ATP-binding protein
VLVTTHELEEAQQRADRIGLLHEGTLRWEGTVAELTRALPMTTSHRAGHTGPAVAVTRDADPRRYQASACGAGVAEFVDHEECSELLLLT